MTNAERQKRWRERHRPRKRSVLFGAPWAMPPAGQFGPPVGPFAPQPPPVELYATPAVQFAPPTRDARPPQ